MEKIRISYTEENDKTHIISILPEQMPYYEKWRQTKQQIDSGKWKGENREKAYVCMQKCVKLFTYQKTKDERIECECGCSIMKCQIARHKNTIKHFKQLDAVNVEEKPKEPIQIADTDKICECGQVISKANYARHIEGNRHAKYMLTNE